MLFSFLFKIKILLLFSTPMDTQTIFIVFFAGLLTGVINSISAAGSLVSLPVLIFAGLPIDVANGTNRIGILALCGSAVMGLKSKAVKHDNYIWWLSLAVIPGAIAGALIAVNIDKSILIWVLRILVFVFILIVLFNPVSQLVNSKPIMTLQRKIIAFVAFFFAGIYGGFIQAGTGFFLMLITWFAHKFPLIKTNYFKNFLMMIYTIPALILFSINGLVNLKYGLILALGGSIGAWAASRWSVYGDPVWVKRGVVTILILLFIKLWI
jgi:hypothetical protein